MLLLRTVLLHGVSLVMVVYLVGGAKTSLAQRPEPDGQEMLGRSFGLDTQLP